MDKPVIGPLLPTVTEPTAKQVGIGGVLLAVLKAATVFPSTTEAVTKFGLGAGINPAKGTIKPTPFLLTWLLPQPVGILPTEPLGITPDWYLPPALATQLPSFVPGADYRRGIDAARVQATNEAKAKADAARIAALIANLSTEALQPLFAQVTGPDAALFFANPAAIVVQLQTEFDRRAAQITSNEAAREARLKGAAATPDTTTGPGGTSAVIANGNAITAIVRGPFVDKVFAVVHGDP